MAAAMIWPRRACSVKVALADFDRTAKV
jgi:hypothetical protein